MPHSALRRLARLVLVLCAVAAVATALPPATASAHNSLLSSDPGDGDALAAAPAQITWVFDKPVPLETMTVTLIDATGARRELPGSTHGAGGDAEVVTPLPALQPGPVSVRWRLVGPDGHPITGRVDFTITAATTTVGVTPSTSPAVPTTPSTTPAVVNAPSPDVGDGSYSTPSLLRWVLRYASYLAIMAVIGILATTAYVWSGGGAHPMLRRILGLALLATAVLAFLQLLVIASDVGGRGPWSSLGSIDAATSTHAGMALAIRIGLAVSMWLVLFRADIVHRDVYWTAVSMAGLGLLATWAFAGHSRSMRWPVVGVATDVAHHAAAATWIAGLAIVGGIVIPATSPDVLVPAVRRFSRVAAISVAALVTTGLVQSVRLVGGPLALLRADHGRLLAAKLVVLAVMLAFAGANRRRVGHHLDDPQRVARQSGALRRAVVVEFAIGLVIIAITVAMVVSPPSSSRLDGAAPPDGRLASILHVVVETPERLPR